MEELEKKLKKARSGNSKLGIFFLIIAVAILLIGILQGNSDKDSWDTFDGMSNNDYYKAEIYYLVGPFAEYTEDGTVVEQLYSAYTTDNNYILVKTGKTTDLPVFGEDVTEENIDLIQPVTAYGYGTELESEVAEFLVQFWNEVYEEEFFSMSNYIEYFGSCYLNTIDQAEDKVVAGYIFAAIFGLLALIILLSNRKNNKNNADILKRLDEEGKLEDLKNEYSKETVQQYKKLNLEITENYVISYSPKLVIVKFADIINVYPSNMIDGVYQTYRYIALETKNNEKYYVAPKPFDSKNAQFDEVLEKIRSKVKQGGN